MVDAVGHVTIFRAALAGDRDESDADICARRVPANGRPLGSFVVRWHEYAESDELLGWYSRAYDASGQPLSGALREGP